MKKKIREYLNELAKSKVDTVTAVQLVMKEFRITRDEAVEIVFSYKIK